MKVIKICYPRVKKTYTYNITQEMLDNMDFTWDEFQNALSDDEHERWNEAEDALSEMYPEGSEQDDIDECGDGDFYEIDYEFDNEDEEDL